MHPFRTTDRRRPTGMAIAAAAALLALSGCAAGGSTAENGSGATGKTSDDPVLQAIKDKGVINVGVCLGAPNWGLIDKDGKPAGFDIGVAELLSEHLGVKLKIVETANDGRIPSLQSGTVDVISCTFTATEARKKQVDFSDPVVYTGNSLLVRKDSNIESLNDLKGVKVGVNKGGTSIVVTTAHAPDAKQVPLDNFATDLTALKAGQVEAVIDTASVITQAANADSSLKIAVNGEVGPPGYFALGVAKGNAGLLKAVNEFVAQFHKDKSGTKLHSKWFWEPTYEFKGLED